MHRLATVSKQLQLQKAENHRRDVELGHSPESLTVTDNRTGKKYNVPIRWNSIRSVDMKLVRSPSGVGLCCYDPGYLNTACCSSSISFIDGERGILQYRGYPIEQLAGNATFEEVAFLLLHGELPTASQLRDFTRSIMEHAVLPEGIKNLICTFRHDAHAMGMMSSVMAALGTYHPETNPCLAGQDVYKSTSVRYKEMLSVLGAAPSIAAAIQRHREGLPIVDRDPNLGFTENFLIMMDRQIGGSRRPHSSLVQALEVLFILHAEHELNCSTAAARHLASSGVDVYTAMSGAIGALYGPKHGGANEAVVRMLEKIGSVDRIPNFISCVKNKKELLMGFGHRVYKSYDPRAKIVRRVAEDVFDVMGREPLIEVALELERTALSDEYFIKRNLYPNVDFYSGLIYKAIGFPSDLFPLLFAVPRMSGWLAHWSEILDDPELKIVRPQQLYTGRPKREFVPLNRRQELVGSDKLLFPRVAAEIRRLISSDG